MLKIVKIFMYWDHHMTFISYPSNLVQFFALFSYVETHLYPRHKSHLPMMYEDLKYRIQFTGFVKLSELLPYTCCAFWCLCLSWSHGNVGSWNELESVPLPECLFKTMIIILNNILKNPPRILSGSLFLWLWCHYGVSVQTIYTFFPKHLFFTISL